MSKHFFRPLWLAAVFAAPAFAQLAPGGFTAAINSPTADVMSTGTIAPTFTNSSPEKARRFPGVGHFGSINLGFGLLPGFELVGRLAYDGDTQCVEFSGPACKSGGRDMSASAKYQLPFRLIGDTRLAIGATDLATGATSLFRSAYGVASSRLGPWDLSLGYGKPYGNVTHLTPTINGVFGSAQLHLTEQWKLLAERDSHEWRTGLGYAKPLTESLQLGLAASRKLSHSTGQQAWQATVGLNYQFDKATLIQGSGRSSAAAWRPDTMPATMPATPVPAAALPQLAPHAVPQPALAAAPGVVTPTQALTPQPAAAGQASASPSQRAEQLASRLRQQGFASISVGFDDAQRWVLQAEPLAWRKNRLDALGVALAVWQQSARPDDQITLALTYLQDPVLTASITALCLAKFTEGDDRCDGRSALNLGNGQAARAPLQGWAITPNSVFDALRPQLEIGAALQQRVGTEYGLYDYSVGLDLGWELPLARGLLWQGQATALPLAHSRDFEPHAVFGADRIRNRLESTTLSYQRRLISNLWAQASVGYVQHRDHGAQAELAWLSPEGRWRLGGMFGRYQGDSTRGWTLETIRHAPAVASARWSVIEGRWFLEAQAGQFYNQDRGFRLSSQHWVGDYRLSFNLRSSEATRPYPLPKSTFAGFELTIPFGPKAAVALGPATVRGRDQWAYGIDVRIRPDPYYAVGYGIVPVQRHGLLSDTLDKDRAGLADMAANVYRVRAMLRETPRLP